MSAIKLGEVDECIVLAGVLRILAALYGLQRHTVCLGREYRLLIINHRIIMDVGLGDGITVLILEIHYLDHIACQVIQLVRIGYLVPDHLVIQVVADESAGIIRIQTRIDDGYGIQLQGYLEFLSH